MEVLRILDEKKLEELVSNMDDRIRMHDYSKEQLLLLIEDYVTINFQGWIWYVMLWIIMI